MLWQRTILIAALLLSPVAVSDAAEVTFSPGENFLVPVLKGWKARASDNRDGLILTEFVPREMSGHGAQSMTLQIFLGRKDMAPADFAGSMIEAFRRRCDPYEGGKPALGRVNGYRSSQVVLSCGREIGGDLGSLTIILAIAADDNFYVVQRAWHGAPFKAGRLPVPVSHFKDWIAFMRAVSVCDTRSDDHPCDPKTYIPFWPQNG